MKKAATAGESAGSAKLLTSGDEGIKNDLCSVEEVSKLSLPDRQELGLGDAHTVLKTENGLLRQRAVTHLHRKASKQHIKGKTVSPMMTRTC